MTTTELGQIETVDVLRLWREAGDTEFARWLSEHLPLLGRPLHLDLERVRLQPPGVGWFGLCILAKEVGSDATVAIAGQLSRTNHERLGQLTAYAAANDARIIVWVAPDFHQEHREALELLNRGTPEQIEAYGVEVRAIKIGDSLPAHEFRPVVFADAMSKRTRAAMFNLTPAVMNRYDFFQPLVERLWDAGFTNKVNAHQARAGNEPFASGFHVVTYYAAYHPDDPDTQPSVYLWIAAGSSDKSGRIYDALLAQCRAQFKNEVDVFEPDYWGERGGWSRVSIGVSRSFSDSRSKQGQDAIRDWMFDTLFKFKEVFHDPLEQVTRKLAEEEAEANAAGSKNNNLGDVPAGTADVVAEAGAPAPDESH